MNLQPSELMKFLSILYVSCYSVRRIKEIQSHWLGFFRPALIIVSIISIILVQPDLGSSAVIFASVTSASGNLHLPFSNRISIALM